MGGGLIASVLAAALLAPGAGPVSTRQPSSPSPYDQLAVSQRRLLSTWVDQARSNYDSEAAIRERFNAAPEQFRSVFEQVTARLAALVLMDPENGEVLGAALDLLDAVEPPERQPTSADDRQLAVTFAPGARDRLRRSAEFDQIGDGSDGRVEFQQAGPPALRISIDTRAASGRISILGLYRGIAQRMGAWALQRGL